MLVNSEMLTVVQKKEHATLAIVAKIWDVLAEENILVHHINVMYKYRSRTGNLPFVDVETMLYARNETKPRLVRAHFKVRSNLLQGNIQLYKLDGNPLTPEKWKQIQCDLSLERWSDFMIGITGNKLLKIKLTRIVNNKPIPVQDIWWKDESYLSSFSLVKTAQAEFDTKMRRNKFDAEIEEVLNAVSSGVNEAPVKQIENVTDWIHPEKDKELCL